MTGAAGTTMSYQHANEQYQYVSENSAAIMYGVDDLTAEDMMNLQKLQRDNDLLRSQLMYNEEDPIPGVDYQLHAHIDLLNRNLRDNYDLKEEVETTTKEL